MIYQDPLAYLLGLEGIALLDARAGDRDRAFMGARLAEVRPLIDDEKLRGQGCSLGGSASVTAHGQESVGYDANAGGGLFAAAEPLVAECLAGRPPGVVLDAACGAGRFVEFLVGRGHRVIGTDSPADILAHARGGSPAASSASQATPTCVAHTTAAATAPHRSLWPDDQAR